MVGFNSRQPRFGASTPDWWDFSPAQKRPAPEPQEGNDFLSWALGLGNAAREAFNRNFDNGARSVVNSRRPSPDDFPRGGREIDRRASSDIRGRTRGIAKRAPEEAPAAQRSLADFLAEAEGMMGGGPDFGALRQLLNTNAAEIDARVQAMYRALGDKMRADSTVIQGYYDKANEAVSGATGEAQERIQGSQQQMADSRSQMLQELGIEDAARQRDSVAETASGTINRINERGAASQAANAGFGASGAEFNTNMAGVAGLEGAEFAEANQRRLGEALTQLGMQEAQTNAQRRERSMQMALQMMGAEREAQELAANGGLTPWQRAQLERDMAQFTAEQQNRQYSNQVAARDTQSQLYRWAFEQTKNPQKAAELFTQLRGMGLA